MRAISLSRGTAVTSHTARTKTYCFTSCSVTSRGRGEGGRGFVTRHYRILNHFHLKEINWIFNIASSVIILPVGSLTFDGRRIIILYSKGFNYSFPPLVPGWSLDIREIGTSSSCYVLTLVSLCITQHTSDASGVAGTKWTTLKYTVTSDIVQYLRYLTATVKC